MSSRSHINGVFFPEQGHQHVSRFRQYKRYRYIKITSLCIVTFCLPDCHIHFLWSKCLSTIPSYTSLHLCMEILECTSATPMSEITEHMLVVVLLALPQHYGLLLSVFCCILFPNRTNPLWRCQWLMRAIFLNVLAINWRPKLRMTSEKHAMRRDAKKLMEWFSALQQHQRSAWVSCTTSTMLNSPYRSEHGSHRCLKKQYRSDSPIIRPPNLVQILV